MQLEDISSIDSVGKLFGLNDIYSLLVKSSMFIQMVNNFPWEYTFTLEKLKKSLSAYAEEVEKLSNNLNNTQKMEGNLFPSLYLSFQPFLNWTWMKLLLPLERLFWTKKKKQNRENFFREKMKSSMKRH